MNSQKVIRIKENNYIVYQKFLINVLCYEKKKVIKNKKNCELILFIKNEFLFCPQDVTTVICASVCHVS